MSKTKLPDRVFQIIFISSCLLLIVCKNIFPQDEPDSSIKENLQNEIQRHPKLKADDIYKFLHQAAFGSEHAVKDAAGVRKWMKNEIAGLDYSIKEDLLNLLSPDGRIARINLRPYLQMGYDAELLLQAFIKTADNYKGAVEEFKLYLSEAVEMSKIGELKIGERELIDFFEKHAKMGFPAVHHSEEYESEYKPAYRVVDLIYLPFLTN